MVYFFAECHIHPPGCPCSHASDPLPWPQMGSSSISCWGEPGSELDRSPSAHLADSDSIDDKALMAALQAARQENTEIQRISEQLREEYRELSEQYEMEVNAHAYITKELEQELATHMREKNSALAECDILRSRMKA